MIEVSFLPASSVRSVPWKNQGGVTHELLSWPTAEPLDEDAFVVRISIAEIEQDGPFSPFPGCDRLLTVVDGQGLLLDHGDEASHTRVRRLEPHPFRGEWPTRAELVAGPVEALNVMTRRGSARATVDALRLGTRQAREALAGDQAFLHVLSGSLTARVTGEEEAFELTPGDSLWLRSLSGGEEIFLEGREPNCELVWIVIELEGVPST